MSFHASSNARFFALVCCLWLAACTSGGGGDAPGTNAPTADGGTPQDAAPLQSGDGAAGDAGSSPRDAAPERSDGGPGGIDVGPARVTFTELHPMFEERCTLCHHVGEMGVMPLFEGEPSDVRAGIVDVPSAEIPSMLLVHPGSPEDSWLLHKIRGTHLAVCEELGVDSTTCGGRMPRGTSEVLTADQIEQVRVWIEDGAR